MIFFIIFIPLIILSIILLDYFLIHKFTKDMEKSIDNIFDNISKSKLVVFILAFIGFGNDDKNDS